VAVGALGNFFAILRPEIPKGWDRRLCAWSDSWERAGCGSLNALVLILQSKNERWDRSLETAPAHELRFDATRVYLFGRSSKQLFKSNRNELTWRGPQYTSYLQPSISHCRQTELVRKLGANPTIQCRQVRCPSTTGIVTLGASQMANNSKKPKTKAKKRAVKGKRTLAKRGANPKAITKKKGKIQVATPAPSRGAGVRLAAIASAVAEVVAEKGCLPYPDAETLVYSCGSPEADGVPSSTPLGNLFGGARLTGFCQCVANGVPCSASKVPSSAGKTLQDVIDAIACK
jgi:hypothetical protein